MRTARVAIIGAGAIARDHATAIAQIPQLRLARVIDRHPERAQALAAAHNAQSSTDPEMLYADDIDAAVICTAPDSHVLLANAALLAGKAVLVEKPVALDADSVDRLLATARSADRPLLVGQTARFQPAHADAAAALAHGLLGRPRLASISWQAGHVWPGGWRSWQLDPSRSGGHVLHNGIHAIDLLTWLLDDTPSRVFVRTMRTWAAEMPTPDTFSITVEFTGGALAVINISYSLNRRGTASRKLVISGTEGSLCIDSDAEPRADTYPPLDSAGVEGAMWHQYKHFRDVVIDGAAPLTTAEQISVVARCAIAAQRSADTGCVVHLSEA